MDDVAAVAEELRALGAAKDASPPALTRLLDALAGDATYYVENESYDGLSPRGWHAPLWEVARDVISELGEVAIDAVVARIRAGDARLMSRAATLGTPIVAEAMLVLERGGTLVPAALEVLRVNARLFSPVDAVVNFLLAYDHLGPEPQSDNMLVESWSKFATPEGRAAILDRWRDAELAAWIEARIDGDAWRARHLAALLAVVPYDEALPLMRRVMLARPDPRMFEPLLVIDVTRAAELIRNLEVSRTTMRSIALRIASGGSHWESGTLDQPRDHALVAAFAGDHELWAVLMNRVEDKVRGARDIWLPEWQAVAAHVVAERSRLDRAIDAAIEAQLRAHGPGKPQGRAGLRTIGALDPQRMLASIAHAKDRIAESKNAWCFEQIVIELTR